MVEMTFEELKSQVDEIIKKPDSEVTEDDNKIVTRYLEHPDFDILTGVSAELLDLINTPEQRAITEKMLAS